MGTEQGAFPGAGQRHGPLPRGGTETQAPSQGQDRDREAGPFPRRARRLPAVGLRELWGQTGGSARTGPGLESRARPRPPGEAVQPQRQACGGTQ